MRLAFGLAVGAAFLTISPFPAISRAVAQSGNNPVDLVEVQLIVPRKVTIGKTFRVLDEVENTGRAAAFQSVTGFFLSEDQTIDEHDIAVGGRRVPQLAPGQSHSMTSEVTLKPTVKPGAYYFIAVADARRELEDRSRLDNVRAVPITVEDKKEK